MELGGDDVRASRRRWLQATLWGTALWTSGCRPRDKTIPPGEWVGAGHALGHRLRGGTLPALELQSTDWRDVDVLIVGGGIAGLSAARRLRQAGVDDFVVLELENSIGGTARSGIRDGWEFPWGAHYLPLPEAENEELTRLLRELDCLEPTGDDQVVGREEVLCRDPQERIFRDGVWHADLDVWEDAPADEVRQWRQWQVEVRRWTLWRDGSGLRAFTLPTRRCSSAPEVRALDRITMARWLAEKGWTSPRLRWLIDYACRDDYGMTIDQVSAWAGLFYFCARMREDEEANQPLLTWPAGNGWIARRMADPLGERLRVGCPVWSARARPDSRWEILAGGLDGERPLGYRARRIICAAPQFVAARVIEGYGAERGKAIDAFEYGSWLVANVFLRDRPPSIGFPLAWDNVSYSSRSLGYVVASHQLGIDFGPTVWTWYHAFCDDDPRAARQRLLDLSREEAAELVLTDLEQMHPEIHELVTRIDVMRWGHAMVRARPGFRFDGARSAAMLPYRGVHFAHTELSGVALFEEAFDHGTRAADEVVAALRG